MHEDRHQFISKFREELSMDIFLSNCMIADGTGAKPFAGRNPRCRANASRESRKGRPKAFRAA